MSPLNDTWENATELATNLTGGSSPLQIATTVVLTSSLVIIMLGVGACIVLEQLIEHIRRPYGILIGAASQFIVLPVTTFALAHILQLPPLQAIGMLIMSCCPGGSTSNMFTLWVKGDVPLSLSMTTVNTALSAGILPLNLLIYSRSWTTTSAVIPYQKLAQGFAMMLIPAVVGIAVRRFKPKVATYLIKAGSVVGAISVIAAMVLISILNPYMYSSSWRIYFAVVFLPFISFGFGYSAAFIFRMPHFRCRTVALETGIQNFPFCMTLLTLSFNRTEMGQLSLYPLLFGVFILVDSVIFVAVFRLGTKLRVKFNWCPKAKNEDDEPAACPLTESPHPIKGNKYPLTECSHVLTESPHPLTESPHPPAESSHPPTESPQPFTENPHPLK